MNPRPPSPAGFPGKMNLGNFGDAWGNLGSSGKCRRSVGKPVFTYTMKFHKILFPKSLTQKIPRCFFVTNPQSRSPEGKFPAPKFPGKCRGRDGDGEFWAHCTYVLLFPSMLIFSVSPFLEKYKGVYICEVLDNGRWLGAGGIFVTSAKVGVNRSVIIKSILSVCVVSSSRRSQSTNILEWKCWTGNWTDLHIEAMRCTNTEFRWSHSPPTSACWW